MPASCVVTNPPTQISKKVAQTNATAQRWGHSLSNSIAVAFTLDFDQAEACWVKRLRRLMGHCRFAERVFHLRGFLLRRRLRLRIVVGVDFGRSVLVGTAVDHRLKIEIAMPGRAGRLPFQTIGMPRIAAGAGTEKN